MANCEKCGGKLSEKDKDLISFYVNIEEEGLLEDLGDYGGAHSRAKKLYRLLK